MNLILSLLLALLLVTQAHAEVVATPKDKQGHLWLGAITYSGCRLMTFKPETCLYTAMGVAAAKEIYDYSQPKKHSTEMMDFAATATGGLLLFTFERLF